MAFFHIKLDIRSGAETQYRVDPLQHGTSVSTQSTWAWFIGAIILAASVLFYRLAALPIQVWDEARLANNALEMTQTGLSIITTYAGLPDHWNTKPPLLIWLMSMSIRVFGPNEWGVRLPSVLAAMVTAVIVFTFCTCCLRRPFVGFLSVLFLFGTPGYIHFHGARTGNYDAMLTLWTTSYLLAGYMFLQEQTSRKTLWLFISAVGILFALFTKTVQGLIFLPALFVYAASQRRLMEVLQSPAIYIHGILILVACGGYYFAREHVDPGYFANAQANDLMGRYGTVLDGHQGGPLFYLLLLIEYPWLVISLAIAAYQIWRGQAERRQISTFLGLVSLFYLLIISSASSKLPWYAMPLCPLSAIIMAIALEQLLEGITIRAGRPKKMMRRMIVAIAILASIGVFASNAYLLNRNDAGMKVVEPDQYSFFLRSHDVQRSSLQKFVVIHPGYSNNKGDNFYIAPALFYVNALRAAGRTILIQPPYAAIPADFNVAVLCGDTVRNAVALRAKLQERELDGTCGIYSIVAK